MTKRVVPILFLLVGILPLSVIAQQRCGTFEINRSSDPSIRSQDRYGQFEEWIKIKKREPYFSGRKRTEPYKIPVVVHVIHNGEAVGSGSNISDAQILSQIKVLNEDFRRENPDASNTPAMFAGVAAGMDIEFVLAKRDPEGKTTNGIVRVKGSKSSYTSADNYEIKAQSYWPSEDYMNLWVCNISDFLGYAQFPVSDLPGLENSSDNAETDGVVLWYRSFGSIDHGNFNLDPDYNKGRTATHEISHFFGLRHTWGDEDGCDGTDHVDDTPNQSTYTRGCPTAEVTSCGVVSMTQNFLDYTDDACMNLFTFDQIERMKIVMESSPRRASLLVSPGLSIPDPFPNDIGFNRMYSPATTQCTNVLIPVVEVKNFGTNKVVSTRIRLTVNGSVVQTKDFGVNLDPGDSVSLTFNNVSATSSAPQIKFEILLTNGVVDSDDKGNDNVIERTVLIPPSVNLPFTETFNTTPTSWYIDNPDQQITWELLEAPTTNETNTAMGIRFYDYESNFGEQDVLYSPVFDLSTTNTASLLFDLAHARYDFSNDRLKILVMTGCRSIDFGEVIYDSAGIRLQTSNPTQVYFTPGDEQDWERQVVSLEQFAGEQFVQLAFVAVNDFGNNLYLDNITVTTAGFADAAIVSIESPSLVTCYSNPAPVVTLQNTGTEIIESISLDVHLSGQNVPATFTGLNLLPGAQQNFTLPQIQLSTGTNDFEIEIHEVNDQHDPIASNNSISTKVVVDNSRDVIPLRQTFDGAHGWSIVNPEDGMEWTVTNTNYGSSAYFNAYDNPDIGDESWLVSPALDLRGTDEASMVFDVSSMKRNENVDDLKLMVSRDCGSTYEQIAYSLPDRDDFDASWEPSDESDWFRNTINLSEFAGDSTVRVAFVVTNGNGNNLYLDNIEFFVTDEPQSVEIENLYSVFGYNTDNLAGSELQVGFNLSRRQDVRCQILNSMGMVVHDIVWDNVLNQIFELPLTDDMATGIYIVRLGINGGQFGERIFVSR